MRTRIYALSLAMTISTAMVLAAQIGRAHV